MNREERRAYIKKAKKKGISKEQAETYLEIAQNGAGKTTEAQVIENGAKVMLNIEAVKARKNYNKLSEKYKAFVEDSDGKVFTAVTKEKLKNVISLEEEPRWLFWSGDLIVVEEKYTQKDETIQTSEE